MQLKTKTVKLFSEDFAYKYGKYEPSPFHTKPDLRWDDSQMVEMHDKILDIIHKKLDNKILVFRNSVIDLERRVTKYAIMHKAEWSEEYKRIFRIEFIFICIEDNGANPFIRLFNEDTDDSVYIEPLSKFEVAEMDDFKEMMERAYVDIKNKFFK